MNYVMKLVPELEGGKPFLLETFQPYKWFRIHGILRFVHSHPLGSS